MEPETLKGILDSHSKWLNGDSTGSRADLRGADLRGADLRDADLRRAYLRGADLRGAYLRGANLSNADLRSADLRSADLRSADLRSADLSNADLSGAYLPSPTMMLLASWGQCSDALTIDLMRYDASNHPDPSKFDEWKNGGACPYADQHIQRAAQFVESRDLYSPGPAPSAYSLMVRLIEEKCKND